MKIIKGTARIAASLLAILSLAASCRPRTQTETLLTGDLIFVAEESGPSDPDSMGGAIAAATSSYAAGSLERVHVAIAEVCGNGVWVIDATVRHGVDRHPIDTLYEDFRRKDGSLPVFEVRRLRDRSHVDGYIRNAKEKLGLPYDLLFLPDNGAYYCSELVYDAYKSVFEAVPMNFLAPDGSMPAYWTELFGRLGTEVPQGVTGTNPQQLSASEALFKVGISLP